MKKNNTGDLSVTHNGAAMTDKIAKQEEASEDSGSKKDSHKPWDRLTDTERQKIEETLKRHKGTLEKLAKR